MGVTDSLPEGSLAMSTAAPTSSATAEDVESLGSPRGCPSGLHRWGYAGCTPAASISSMSTAAPTPCATAEDVDSLWSNI